MPIKLIVTDMDGTLLNPDHAVTDRTVAAFAAARARGAYTTLASGRMIEAMTETAEQVGINAPFIAYNGGAVCDMTGLIIHQAPITAHLAREVCALAESMGILIHGYQDGGYLVADHNPVTDGYADVIKIRPTYTGMPLSEWIEKDQLKLLLVGDADQLGAAMPKLRAQFDGRVNCINSVPTLIECTMPGVNKGQALLDLAGSLGVQPDEILAFGDGENDLEMLLAAGYGYAMGNAPDSVKAAAKFVAPPNTEDGVAQIIEQYIHDGRI